MSLFRTKPINTDLTANTGLKRSLGPWDLTFLGVGAIIGAGIFVLTGVAAATKAGPAIVLSYVVAGLACGFAALAYAELASSVGGSGSAYGYAYAGLGEIIAWIIGWALMLEYGLAVSAVAIGWSGYFVNGLSAIGITMPPELVNPPHSGGIVNLPAVAIIVALGTLLCVGVSGSAKLNAFGVTIKVVSILVFIAVAIGHVNADNWTPFAPYGFSGIMGGAGLIFFAYIGFDAVSTAADEAKNPQRDMPIGIIASLVVCTILYMIVAGLLTGIANYETLNNPSPVSKALLDLGINWAGGVTAVGAVAGLTTVILVCYYAQSRVLFAMSRDGLLPSMFRKVNDTTRTPVNGIVFAGVVMAAIAGFARIDEVAQLTNMGTLLAFTVVCVGVMVLRKTRPDLHRPFRTPLMPVVPILGIVFCVWLMVSLPLSTWRYFAIWMALGLVIYFAFSRRHSELNKTNA